jgi:hypothetical protein
MIKKFIKKTILVFHEQRKIYNYRKKITILLKEDSGLVKKKSGTYNNAESVRKYWECLYKKPSLNWHLFYEKSNGCYDKKYCPEDIFYTYIEPKLNNSKMWLSYADKNFYDKILNSKTPNTIIRCINGYFYDKFYNLLCLSHLVLPDGEFVIKPSIDHGGGAGVEKVEIFKNSISIKGRKLDIDGLMAMFKYNFIIQEIVKQATELSVINPPSVNTLRITTLRIDNEIKILSTVLRYGMSGSFVDNQRSGGASVGVNKDGTLKKFSYDRHGNKATAHPETNVTFEGYQIPKYQDAINLVEKLHLDLPHFDMVSWDVCITKNYTPCVIELNLMGQGINLHQLSNGPLFGEYTDYIVRRVEKNRNLVK